MKRKMEVGSLGCEHYEDWCEKLKISVYSFVTFSSVSCHCHCLSFLLPLPLPLLSVSAACLSSRPHPLLLSLFKQLSWPSSDDHVQARETRYCCSCPAQGEEGEIARYPDLFLFALILTLREARGHRLVFHCSG